MSKSCKTKTFCFTPHDWTDTDHYRCAWSFTEVKIFFAFIWLQTKSTLLSKHKSTSTYPGTLQSRSRKNVHHTHSPPPPQKKKRLERPHLPPVRYGVKNLLSENDLKLKTQYQSITLYSWSQKDFERVRGTEHKYLLLKAKVKHSWVWSPNGWVTITCPSWDHARVKFCALLHKNQSIFYFMSVHIEVILDQKQEHVIYIILLLFILIFPQDYEQLIWQH